VTGGKSGKKKTRRDRGNRKGKCPGENWGRKGGEKRWRKKVSIRGGGKEGGVRTGSSAGFGKEYRGHKKRKQQVKKGFRPILTRGGFPGRKDGKPIRKRTATKKKRKRSKKKNWDTRPEIIGDQTKKIESRNSGTFRGTSLS